MWAARLGVLHGMEDGNEVTVGCVVAGFVGLGGGG
jgi:hypothetical protein